MYKWLVASLVLLLGAAAKDCSPPSCPTEGIALLSDPRDCSRFISCINGASTYRHCPQDHHFNIEYQRCLHKDIAKCEDCDNSEENQEIIPLLNLLRAISNYDGISQRCIQNSVTPVTCPTEMGDNRLLPHPDDCHLFYICETPGQPPTCRECPAKLYFNPKKSVCDYPEVAGCLALDQPKQRRSLANKFNSRVNYPTVPLNQLVECNSHNSAYADLKPHPTDCGKYHVCDWGTLNTMDCPANLHFNPILKVCDYPERAGCQANQNITTTSPPQNITTTSPPQNITTASPPQNITTASPPQNNTLQNNSTTTELPDLGNIDQFVPECYIQGETIHDKSNCSRYFICDKQFMIPMECPPGLFYGSLNNTCVRYEYSWCNYNETNYGEANKTESEFYEQGNPQETLIPRELEKCVQQSEDFADLRPNPEDCSKYFVCDTGYLIPMDCPKGLHYDTLLRVCTFPEYARCQVQYGNWPFKIDRDSHESDEDDDHEYLGRTESTECEQINSPYADLRPNPKDCNKYFVCDWNKLIPMDCPEGLHFNAVTKVCSSPYDANCPLFKPYKTPKELLFQMRKKLDSEEDSDSSEDDRKRKYFSHNFRRLRSAGVECQTSEDKDNVELLPNPESCTSFYTCSWGIPHLTFCPPGLHFNPHLLVCDYPENAGCQTSIAPLKFNADLSTKSPIYNYIYV